MRRFRNDNVVALGAVDDDAVSDGWDGRVEDDLILCVGLFQKDSDENLVRRELEFNEGVEIVDDATLLAIVIFINGLLVDVIFER